MGLVFEGFMSEEVLCFDVVAALDLLAEDVALSIL